MAEQRPGWRDRLAAWARRLKTDALALWFALRDPRTPPAVKLLAALIVAYALSPIDLIPDFIPLLGFVDDLLLLPGLIWLALRWLPPAVLADCRARAAEWMARGEARPKSRAGALLVLALWALAAAALLAWWWPAGAGR